jgi:hypothetical protein
MKRDMNVVQGNEGTPFLCNQQTFLVLLGVLILATSCVSRSTYNELKEELRREREEEMALRDELNSRKLKRIEALEIRLSSCQQQIVATKEAGERMAKKAEEAGYYRDAAEFNSSLQVVGVPSSDGSWLFAEHYYTFQVRLAGQPLYSMTVETEEEMPPVLQGLALLSELSEVMPYKSKM